MDCLPKSNSGKDNAMVVVCRISKMCKILRCTKELKADEAACLFWDNIKITSNSSKEMNSNFKPLEEIEKIVDKQNRAICRGHGIEYRVRFKGKTEDNDLRLPLYALKKAGKFIKSWF
ncbi:hypothetical protein ACTFIV_005173 [Dictyostelium citrinum]